MNESEVTVPFLIPVMLNPLDQIALKIFIDLFSIIVERFAGMPF